MKFKQVLASVMFTGQGSQFVGMSNQILKTPSLLNHPHVHHLRSEYPRLYNLLEKHQSTSRISDEEELTLTSKTQPGILAHSMLVWDLFHQTLNLRKKESPVFENFKIQSTIGHSLGEYTALVASGIISFEEGLKLVKKSGEIMELFHEQHQGDKKECSFGMMALIPCDYKKAKEIIKNFHEETQNKWFLEISSINSDKQIILSGSNEAFYYLKTFFSLKKKWGITNFPSLKVSIPHHSSLMKECEKKFEPFLESAIGSGETLGVPYQLFSNVSGEEVKSKDELVGFLKKQMSNTIDWYGCMRNCVYSLNLEKERIQKQSGNPVETYVIEMGPKNILRDIMNEMNFFEVERPNGIFHVNDLSSIQQFLDSLIVN